MPHFDKIKEYLSEAFSAAYDEVKQWLGEAINFIEGVPGKLASLGSKMLSAGKNLISSFLHGLATVGGDIGSVAKEIVDTIIDFINSKVIDPIKDFHFRISVAGFGHTFQPFGSLPDIPQLAEGGLTSGETFAMIGDNPSGQEAVLPMDSPETVHLFSKVFDEAMGSPSGAGNAGDLPTKAEIDRLLAQMASMTDALQAYAGRPHVTELDGLTIARSTGEHLNALGRI